MKQPRQTPAASLTAISIARTSSSPSKLLDVQPVEKQVTILEPSRAHAPIPIPIPTNDDAPATPRAFPSVSPLPDGPDTEHETSVDTLELSSDDAFVAPAAIIDLWEHLAENRLRPKIGDLDPLVVARQWPNSLLLRVSDTSRRPALEVAHMFAPSAGGPTVAIPIDAMTVDWIVALGREVVATGSPVHETDAVPTSHGAINCGVIVLPFGPREGVDHVLCHLYRADESLLEGEVVQEMRLPPRDRTGIKRLFGR